jgi:hypothetical protein
MSSQTTSEELENPTSEELENPTPEEVKVMSVDIIKYYVVLLSVNQYIEFFNFLFLLEL